MFFYISLDCKQRFLYRIFRIAHIVIAKSYATQIVIVAIKKKKNVLVTLFRAYLMAEIRNRNQH